ncbi:MAG: GH36 C-terminal domain-containing protein, partial [Clostridia bacterium]|nr:GH36 C-terminal domain-containing protein [Clostridia bacterium]
IMREPADRPIYIKLKGLDSNKMYIDEDTDEVYSGALLMNAGLAFTRQRNSDGESFKKYFKAVE